MQRVEQLYDTRAGVYESHMNRVGYGRAVFDILESSSSLTEFPEVILDLGCGTGITTGALKRIYPRSQITGVDCSENMLEIYRSRFPDVRTIKGNFNDLRTLDGLESDSFDAVFSTCAVSEYGDFGKALPLVYRVLRPEGTFITIGIKRNPVSWVTGPVWGYSARGERAFCAACRRNDFREVQKIKFPGSLPATIARVTRFGVSARK